jgi:dTDP-4-dehydrorhamnose 3,5-epimerase
MQVKTTSFDGLIEIFPDVFEDNRGWFYEFYKEETFKKHNVHYSFVQENQSFSKRGVVRGLHFQTPPFAQAKLVTALTGKVLDVVVDLRPKSATFRQTYYCLLESSKRNMLMVPEGGNLSQESGGMTPSLTFSGELKARSFLRRIRNCRCWLTYLKVY